MSLVVDASVAAKWLVPEADAEKAEAILVTWERGALEILAPEIIHVEIASMLWKRILRDGLPPAEARRLYRRFTQLGIPLAAMPGLTGAALDVALEFRRSIYDGLYVALAVELGWSLVTADERLHNALAEEFPQIVLLRDWRA